jgi:hypothetical protein
VTSAPLPRPLAADGAVTIDHRERALVVRPARDARAYAKVLWAEGVRAQAKAATSGYPGDAPTVWASACGESKVTYGVPAGGDALKFRFGRGDPVYRKLVSTPGLRATFVVDRGSSQILGVRFHVRPPRSERT